MPIFFVSYVLFLFSTFFWPISCEICQSIPQPLWALPQGFWVSKPSSRRRPHDHERNTQGYFFANQGARADHLRITHLHFPLKAARPRNRGPCWPTASASSHSAVAPSPAPPSPSPSSATARSCRWVGGWRSWSSASSCTGQSGQSSWSAGRFHTHGRHRIIGLKSNAETKMQPKWQLLGSNGSSTVPPWW